jgi:signal transduction histidine kinase
MTVDLPNEVPTITGDQDQLIQVMVNLVSNAVKFCKSEQGHIHIILAHQNSRLLLSVEDNGIGISKENQQIIFQQFQQISTAGRGRPQGSGLGLAITKRIVEFHAGQISVESELGKGTKFTLILPIRKL